MKIKKSTQNKLMRLVKRHTKNATLAVFLCLSIIGASWIFNNREVLTPKVAQELVLYDTEVRPTIRCIDGDTFSLNEKTIRLLAIDTPETVKPNSPVESFGKEASEYTCNLIQNAQGITLKQDQGNEIDKYGRTLAWVYLDGQLLQELLIQEGLAQIKYVDKRTVDIENLKLLEVKQTEAKNRQINIWSE